MKFCTDCKHYLPPPEGMSANDYSRCSAYRLAPNPSRVTGEPGAPSFCKVQRSDPYVPGCCGPQGLGFEAAVILSAEAA